ncbi:molecular chaperone HtpG [Porphyromonadaceae bacterium W3.11]|nr:molecular chaperone HtpG [Porphyromonadaceae bacterium W3.11]
MSKEKKNGKIGVQSDNMFPIIKKFLYSDHEIFLRELVSNAVDASQKLKTLSSKGEYSGSLDNLKVEVKIDGDKLIISDHGIGMSADEIDKYINQIAISGAEEFIEKYKDDAGSIIGHFGLGFYSSFMVAKKVEIYTQSYREEEESIRWSCEGDPEYKMEVAEKRERGTDIILYIDEESKEFLEPQKIRQLLDKYCRFLPIPIVFGKKKDWKDGKEVETDEDLIINENKPIWSEMPSELKDEDYKNFYNTMYPMSEAPLFWIHLNIDYPFNLTGILYFPKVKNNMDLQKNKIQLYSNQVFVTDSVEGIVPDFLMLLHGVIDSPDIPLNVSRSYLQADGNVKKISSYITRKVSDKLNELFKEDRKKYEEKWEVLDLFVKYGMLTDEKFYDKAEKFALLKSTDDKLYTLEEYRELISAEQTDKDGNVIYLYANDTEKQYSYIREAKNKGYDVLLMDGQLDIHFIQMLESKVAQSRFASIDSDTLDNLIPKEDAPKDTADVSEEEVELLTKLFDLQLPHEQKVMYNVRASHQGEMGNPLILVQSEYMRRMKDMAAMQQGMSFYEEMPDSYIVNLNVDHPMVRGLAVAFNETADGEYKELTADKRGHEARVSVLQQQLEAKDIDDAQKETLRNDMAETNKSISEIDEKLDAIYRKFGEEHKIISQLIDLGLLSSGLLKGKALDDFVNRSLELIKGKH